MDWLLVLDVVWCIAAYFWIFILASFIKTKSETIKELDLENPLDLVVHSAISAGLFVYGYSIYHFDRFPATRESLIGLLRCLCVFLLESIFGTVPLCLLSPLPQYQPVFCRYGAMVTDYILYASYLAIFLNALCNLFVGASTFDHIKVMLIAVTCFSTSSYFFAAYTVLRLIGNLGLIFIVLEATASYWETELGFPSSSIGIWILLFSVLLVVCLPFSGPNVVIPPSTSTEIPPAPDTRPTRTRKQPMRYPESEDTPDPNPTNQDDDGNKPGPSGVTTRGKHKGITKKRKSSKK